MKINQMPEFYTILARKIIKIPEFLYLPEKLTFYTIFDRKMPEFYIIIARKVFSLLFLGGARDPPSPTPMFLPYEVCRKSYLLHAAITSLELPNLVKISLITAPRAITSGKFSVRRF